MDKKTRGANHQWVKDDIKLVLSQWVSKTTEQLAEEIGCSPQQVTYIAAQARKLGYDLPKKRKNGVVQNLLNEVIVELRK